METECSKDEVGISASNKCIITTFKYLVERFTVTICFCYFTYVYLVNIQPKIT